MSFPGHELRARRLELSLSIEGAAAGSAVPEAMIQALEESALERLPAACYTVGFIRSYCRQLDLEPEHYVSALHVALNGPVSATHHDAPAIASFLRKLPIPDLSGAVSEFQAWVVIIAIMIFGWTAYTLVVGTGDPHDAPQVQAATIDLRLPDDLNGN